MSLATQPSINPIPSLDTSENMVPTSEKVYIFPDPPRLIGKWYFSVIVFSAVLTPFHGVSSLYLLEESAAPDSSSRRFINHLDSPSFTDSNTRSWIF